MSAAHAECRSTGSTDRPMIFTSRRSNSGLIFAMYPSSVVQTGVKSFGCENSTAQESPIHSWNRIGPSVVCASKSGALWLIVSVIALAPLVGGRSRMVVDFRPRRGCAARGDAELAGKRDHRVDAQRVGVALAIVSVFDDPVAVDDEVGGMSLDAAVVAERLGVEAGAHRPGVVASHLAGEHSAEGFLDAVGVEDPLLGVGDCLEREVIALLALGAGERRVEQDHGR